MIALTFEERERFALYLEEGAQSDLDMVEQLRGLKLSGLAEEGMAKRLTAEATAGKIIALKLRSIDTEGF